MVYPITSCRSWLPIGSPATTPALQVEGIFAHPVLALRTLREVKLLAHLQHPNILCLHELYLDGPSFKDGLPMAAEN